MFNVKQFTLTFDNTDQLLTVRNNVRTDFAIYIKQILNPQCSPLTLKVIIVAYYYLLTVLYNVQQFHNKCRIQ